MADKKIRKSDKGDQWFIVVYDDNGRYKILSVYYSREKAEDYLGEYYKGSVL